MIAVDGVGHAAQHVRRHCVPTRAALVDHRREIAAFHQHDRTVFERRQHFGVQHLRPCRGEQQRLGERIEVAARWVEQESAQRFTGRRRTRLPQVHDVVAEFREPCNGLLRMDRFPGRVTPFENEVAT